MARNQTEVVVAGHICLDVIPSFSAGIGSNRHASRIEPGQLYQMGPAVCATGGAVSNTGIALHQLGIPTTLVGRVGDDLFGNVVLDILRRYHSDLVEGMIVAPGENTSYSIVISPPGIDRSFLHCPGANDTFLASDISPETFQGARLFHFGYPPLMQQTYSDGGQQLFELFKKLQAAGVVTSLDRSLPDPRSIAGGIDWRAWLARVLPAVDFFSPSIDEILFMLDREQYDNRLQIGVNGSNNENSYDVHLLCQLSEELLSLGATVIVLKLGPHGLYLRSGEKPIPSASAVETQAQSSWRHREMIAPCFEVEVAGTTGAGDCTIAGLLAAVVNGAGPTEAIVQAVAVGACSVEVPDATSGINNLEKIQQRIAMGWRRHAPMPLPAGWNWNDKLGVCLGSNNAN